MSIHGLLETTLKNALANAEKTQQKGFKTLSFGSKNALKNFADIGQFADESLYLLVQQLVQQFAWAVQVKPAAIDRVAGLATVKLTIDLAYFDYIARYCGYIKLADQAQQLWLDYLNQNNLPFAGFRWQKWGSSIELAVMNIQRAKLMLSEECFSQHQLSAILVHDAKQLKEQDIQDLIVLYPELAVNLRQRRIILNVHCSCMPTQCLIVENMDTYHYLRELIPPDWLLVCGFGQRVTKKNVRDLSVADIHISAQTPTEIHAACREFWQRSTERFLYWGDLDKNGEQIFHTLKIQIPQLEKWAVAYDAMMSIAESHSIAEVHQESVLIDPSFF